MEVGWKKEKYVEQSRWSRKMEKYEPVIGKEKPDCVTKLMGKGNGRAVEKHLVMK